jgi:hypothetical protein
MVSPFPGMDPYLEQPAFWSSFHSKFVVAMADAIEAQLGSAYYVEVETRSYLDEKDTMPLVRHLEIREITSDSIVTVIELLSPKNKRTEANCESDGNKRALILGSSAHRVEINLSDFTDHLPTVPIPLTEKEPELEIDLQAVFSGVYGRSRYHQRIDYRQTLPPPNLQGSDQAWVKHLLAARV